jgi:hypothetical protein
MHRYACEGPCPVYTLIIDGEGEATITFQDVEVPIDTTGEHGHRYHTPKDSVMMLLSLFQQIHFFDLRDMYPEYNTDFPSVSIWLRLDGREKRVMLPEWSINALKSLADTVLVRQMNDLDRLAYRIDIASRDSEFVAENQKRWFKR